MSVNVGTAIGYLDLDTNKFKNGLKTAQQELQGFTNKSNDAGSRFQALGNTLTGVGGILTTAVSVPLLAVGAGAIKVAGDFQAGMSKVQAISGATGSDMKKLENMAKEMGATTKFSARDAADALSYMGMAGWKTEDMMAGLPGVLDLAAAGGTDLALTSDIVTDGLTGLGLTAKDTGMFVDVMAATCANSNTSVELMGETLKYVGPVAGALGIEMDDLSLAIGLMGNAGIKGSQAGTALRAGLTNLVKPTDQMQAAMEKYGVELVKNSDGSINLMGTMENLRSTLGGLDQATQAQALATIFGKEAMSGWAAIVNASEGDFNKLTEAIANSEGKAKEMAETMQDNLKGSIDNMKSAFEGVLITIGERLIPIFRKLIDNITNLLTWFNNLNPAIQNVIIVVGGLLAAVGPLLLIIGKLSIVLGKGITAITKFGLALKTNLLASLISVNTFIHASILPALSSFATFLTATVVPALTATAFTIGAITVPVWAVIAVIAALIAIGYVLIKNWDEIKAKATEVWNNIKEVISQAWEAVKSKTIEVWENIKSALTQVWESIKNITEPAVNFVKDIVTMTWDFICNTTSEIWDSIKSIIQSVWELIKAIINLNGTIIRTFITTTWEAIKSITTTVWNAIKSIIQTVWNAIKPFVTSAINSVKNTMTTVWNSIKSVTSSIWNSIKSAIDSAWNNIKSAATSSANVVKSTVMNAWNNVKSVTTSIWNAIKNAIQSSWTSIKSVVTTGANAIKSTISRVFSTLTNIMTAPFRSAQRVISGILGGITSSINKVTSGIKKATAMFKSAKSSRSIAIPQAINAEEIPQMRNEADYSSIRFSYDRAKQVSISDVLAKNNSMIEGIKGFTKGIKSEKDTNVKTENSVNINLNIENFNNNREQDPHQLMDEIAFIAKRKAILG